MNNNESRVFRVALATSDVTEFLGKCRANDWYAVDTGERIMTEEGPDGEAILLVEPVERASIRRATAVLH